MHGGEIRDVEAGEDRQSHQCGARAELRPLGQAPKLTVEENAGAPADAGDDDEVDGSDEGWL